MAKVAQTTRPVNSASELEGLLRRWCYLSHIRGGPEMLQLFALPNRSMIEMLPLRGLMFDDVLIETLALGQAACMENESTAGKVLA